MKSKVLFVFGTRPEAIKMAPIIKHMASSTALQPLVCVTAQHREMLDQVLDIFDIIADYDLNIMSPGQDLFDISSKVLLGLRDVLRECKPDLVLVHGDTSTCLLSGLSAFYEQIPLGHIEAGLRTGSKYAPFPEEANRTMVSSICDFNFAPTNSSRDNLLRENISEQSIFVTGNTVIDALFWVKDKISQFDNDYWQSILGAELVERVENPEKKVVLITGHRRENFGGGFEDLCQAIKTLANRHRSLEFIYPVHLNPNVLKPVNSILSGIDNIHLIAPLDYQPFVWLMTMSSIILTDSGGVQEEAPSLGKPVLVMRDVTERPEAVDAGTVKLVGTQQASIVASVEALISDAELYRKMSSASNPYGDGKASARICSKLEAFFEARI